MRKPGGMPGGRAVPRRREPQPQVPYRPKIHPARLASAALIIACLWLPALAGPAAAEVDADALSAAFPGAERFGPFGGKPPAAAAYRAGERLGFVFSTKAVTGSVGFSGKPIDILAGVDNDGRITGAVLISHSEPILVIGVAEKSLHDFVAGYAGINVRQRVTTESESGLPDAIAGATISSAVIRDAILRSARTVARSRGLIGAAAGARLDRESFGPATWTDLLADGSVVRFRLARGAMVQSFDEVGGHLGERERADPEGLFIELFAALATPPRVGQNLLGRRLFNRTVAGLGVDDQILMIAAQGLYSFKGTGWWRSGAFDRIQVVQGEKTIRLTKRGYRNVERLAPNDAPELREVGIFVIPGDTGFDALRPWRLELLVTRDTESGGSLSRTFALSYVVPARYRIGGPSEAEAETDAAGAVPETLWVGIWQQSVGRIAILSVMLLALTAILVFQDSYARHGRFYRITRIAFLAFTLVWLGWYAGAQLSVVNVMMFIHSLLTEFQWEFFLLDPLAFLLWSFVAMAMLFWGRGVFCGWLCPFGALQELLNEGARALHVPQISVPFALHERLWPLKYLIFLGLMAVSLHSTNLAVMGAEVEPFKTAISLKFQRHWPFVMYAVMLLAAGLTIERFFCRYLCPLGGALAIPARLHMFNWLQRRFQCGRECGICAQRCTVQAIHPNGYINPNECIHCLNCQALFHDDKTCPPLIVRRRQRERRAAQKEVVAAAMKEAKS